MSAGTMEFMFQPPEWFDADKAGKAVEAFSYLWALTMYDVAGAVGAVQKLGFMPDRVKRIFEFGSGLGEGLVALDMFAESQGEETKVIGSEIDENYHRLARLTKNLLAPRCDVKKDGIAALQADTAGFDLIFAHLFGPAKMVWRDPVEKFMPLALGRLTTNGILVMSSDIETMEVVREWSDTNPTAGVLNVIDPRDLPPAVVIQRQHFVFQPLQPAGL